MATKVKSPNQIRLKTTKTMARNTKPRTGRISHNDQDSMWKSGIAGGTNLGDYRLDVMRLS
jgi:hypothetical protein